jgi:hypothetical protein
MAGENDRKSTQPELFFGGFVWPVPRAFEAAVAQPRFEQGDVLYRDERGYGRLEGEVPAGLTAIQVLHPPRSAHTAAGADAVSDRRQSAWDSEVTIEQIELASGTSEVRVLTQGKLFTALWRGNEEWLDPDSEQPPPPRTARELQGQLPSVGDVLAARRFPGPRRKGCRFLFVVDESSSASRSKASLIESALRAKGKAESVSLMPADIGIAEAETYHPALCVRGLFLPGRSETEVHATLRDALYGRTAGRSEGREDAEPSADRFSLARHGLLESF